MQNTTTTPLPGRMTMSTVLASDTDECRAEIDRIDNLILQALDLRAQTVQRLAAIKRRDGVAAFDPAREAVVLERVTTQRNTLPSERRRAIFRTIMAQMREWQVTLD